MMTFYFTFESLCILHFGCFAFSIFALLHFRILRFCAFSHFSHFIIWDFEIFHFRFLLFCHFVILSFYHFTPSSTAPKESWCFCAATKSALSYHHCRSTVHCSYRIQYRSVDERRPAVVFALYGMAYTHCCEHFALMPTITTYNNAYCTLPLSCNATRYFL